MNICKPLQDLLGTDPDITIISYVVNCLNNNIDPTLLEQPECHNRFNDAMSRLDMRLLFIEHVRILTDHAPTSQTYIFTKQPEVGDNYVPPTQNHSWNKKDKFNIPKWQHKRRR